MNKIEVAVLEEFSTSNARMMMFLAKLTQRGHNISSMKDLQKLFDVTMCSKLDPTIVSDMCALPHGTIKRFTPITIAIVGASRRFLSQVRTHQVGFNFVSASLQYSDYTGKADFVVPYELIGNSSPRLTQRVGYLTSCNSSMETYENLIKGGVDNDTAGYAVPQGLRNTLIMQGNHQSWAYFIRTRGCNRNTNEMQYVALKIWDLLYTESTDGEYMFEYAGPDCTVGNCREGKMSCSKPMNNTPIENLQTLWPRI